MTKKIQIPEKIYKRNFLKSILMFFRKNIKTKLLLAFSVSVVFIVALGVVSYKLASEELKSSAEESSLQMIKGQGNYLKLMSETVEAITSQILMDEGVQKLYISQRDNLEEGEKRRLAMDTSDFFESTVFANSHFIRSIALIGLEDSIITDKEYSIKILDDLKDMRLYSEALKANRRPVWIGDPEELVKLFDGARDISEANLSCVRVLKDNSNGKVVGVLIIELNPMAVESVIDGIKTGRESEVHFISSEGFDMGTIANQAEFQISDGYKFSSDQLYSEIKNSEEASAVKNINYGGKEHILIYCKPEGTDFVIASLIKMSSLLETANRILTVTLILTTVAAGCSLIAAFVISGGMSRTIDQLVQMAEKAASGDLTYRPKSKRQDELGVLARHMCTMMESMRLLIIDTVNTSKKVSRETEAVNESIGQMTVISEEIGKAMDEIAKGTTQQAADSEKVVVKTIDLEQKIGRVSESIGSIQLISDNTMLLTQDCIQIAHELNSKVQETNKIINEILQDIHSMDERSEAIGRIVNFINNIGKQTNLLALNAAIEAAKAGEAGMGFAVVASQIRKLADQSMEATKEITGIVKDVQNQTKQTVDKAMSSEDVIRSQNEALKRTIDSFNDIYSSINEMFSKVNAIMDDVREMEECKNTVLESIQNISSVSEETAAMSEEVSASAQKQIHQMQQLYSKSDNLEQEAILLRKSVAKFRTEIATNP